MPSVFHSSKFVAGLYVTSFALLFLPEWMEFFHLWSTATIYGHGFLVLGASCYLLYKAREDLASLSPSFSALGFAALTVTCLILLIGKAADIKTIRLLFLPFLILSWGWTIWGWNFLKLAGIPISLLVFATPIWDDMSPVFQALTVAVNGVLLGIVHIPADIQEFYISIPAGVFHVAGGCSGVRYLMVGLFLSTFYGALYYPNTARRILLIGFGALLSMIANWIRVFGIIVIGHISDMQSSIVRDHELFGWVTFVIVCLIPLFFLARKLEPQEHTANPVSNKPIESSGAHGSVAGKLVASGAVILVPLIFYTQSVLFEKDFGDWSPALPSAETGWQGPLRFAEFWSPDFVGADISLNGTYVSDQLQRVQFQMEAYRQQSQGKELVYYQNRVFDENQWTVIQQTVAEAPSQNNFGIDNVTETLLSNRARKQNLLIWSWYRLDDFNSPSRIEVKLVGGLKQLTGDSHGAWIALAAECNIDLDSCTSQREAFSRFVTDFNDSSL